jgi:glutathione S-transferase
MPTLYSDQSSTNCYKVRLLASHLELPLTLVDVDILQGQSRTPDFLSLNPNGEVPVLELGDGRRLAESNAMLLFLADGTPLLPDDAYRRARVLQWMFFEQSAHESTIASARFWLSAVKGGRELKRDLIDDWMERGYRALGVMDRHLAGHAFFVDGALGVADLALYAATHVAHEGEFDLAPFPAVRRWLGRIAALPRHVDMAWRPG